MKTSCWCSSCKDKFLIDVMKVIDTREARGTGRNGLSDRSPSRDSELANNYPLPSRDEDGDDSWKKEVG